MFILVITHRCNNAIYSMHDGICCIMYLLLCHGNDHRDEVTNVNIDEESKSCCLNGVVVEVQNVIVVCIEINEFVWWEGTNWCVNIPSCDFACCLDAAQKI